VAYSSSHNVFFTQCGFDTNKNVLKYYRRLILNNLNNPWL